MKQFSKTREKGAGKKFNILLLGLISLVLVILKPPSTIAKYIILIMDVFLIWVTIYFTRYYTGSERYTVRLRDDGLQFGADETVPVVSWSEIRKLRTRRFSEHVEVLGRDDKPRGVIRLQLEGISDLLQILMNTLWKADPQIGAIPLRTCSTLRFKGSPYRFIIIQIMVAGFVALGIKMDPDKWYAIPVFLSPLWLVSIYNFVKEIRWIELTDGLLVVKTVFSRHHFTSDDISSVELFIPAPRKSGHPLNVLIRLPKEEIMGICPRGQDPFIIFWNCRRLLNCSDEIRLFQQEEGNK